MMIHTAGALANATRLAEMIKINESCGSRNLQDTHNTTWQQNTNTNVLK